jgi:hypothetical protein
MVRLEDEYKIMNRSWNQHALEEQQDEHLYSLRGSSLGGHRRLERKIFLPISPLICMTERVDTAAGAARS